MARSIEQYKNHPSIVAIKSKTANKYFKFNSISKAEIEKEILNLDSSKACQGSDILAKVIKSNSDIFTDALYSEFIRSLETSVFPPSMKLANVAPVHKKGNRSEKKITIGQLAYYLICIFKFLKDVFITKYLNFLIKYFLNISAVSGRATAFTFP